MLDNSPEWVISRVFEYGSIADIDQVIALYGTEKVVGILTKTTMRPITRAMAFLFLGIDSDGRYHV